jgi:hypothetical protein
MNEGPGRQVCWQELTKGECFGLLARQQVGRVAVVGDWRSDFMPLTSENVTP